MTETKVQPKPKDTSPPPNPPVKPNPALVQPWERGAPSPSTTKEKEKK